MSVNYPAQARAERIPVGRYRRIPVLHHSPTFSNFIWLPLDPEGASFCH